MTATFEEVRSSIEALEAARDELERRISWINQEQSLGVARSSSGLLELFMVAKPLHAGDGLVREKLVYDNWTRSDGGSVPANRLVLDSGEEYNSAGAVILVELERRGFGSDSANAFALSEPFIALVLQQVRVQNQVVTGLAGELTLMSWLIESGLQSAESVCAAWFGWGHSTRDFQFNTVGVEVKTTTLGVSKHHIQGLHQIEPGLGVDGVQETALYMLSIGIRWLNDASGGSTLSELVTRIAGALLPPVRDLFIRRVRNYCDAALDFDEQGLSDDPRLNLPFFVDFERLYDLDPSMGTSLLRSEHLAEFSNVVSESISLTVEFRNQIRGTLNPISGRDAIVSRLLTP